MASRLVCDNCDAEYTRRSYDDDSQMKMTWKNQLLRVHISWLEDNGNYQHFDFCQPCQKILAAEAIQGWQL